MSSLQRHLRAGFGRIAEPHVVFPLIAILLLGVIWGTTFNMIRAAREGATTAAAASAQELTDTYEAQALRALREIDQTLKLVKFEHQRAGGGVDLQKFKSEGLLPPDLLFVVAVTDAQGNVRSTTRPARNGNVSHLAHFRGQVSDDAIALGGSQEGSGQEWQLHFSRALKHVDGRFAGIVSVSVAATHFVSGYEQSRLGTQGVLGLLGADGVFRARRTGDLIRFQEAAGLGAIETLRTDQAPIPTVNAWDGVRRFTAARELFDFPLAVVVGLSEEEQLAPVQSLARTYLWQAAAASIVLALVLAGLGFFGTQIARTRARANRELQEEVAVRRRAEAALNLRNRAIESSVNAIVITDHSRPDHPIEYVNPAFERITGYPAAEVIGRGKGFLLGGDRGQQGQEEIDAAVSTLREAHAVVRNYRKDGSLFWNECHIAPVRDGEGQVTHFVEVMNDVTDAKAYEEQLTRQANFDTLTGLANRNLLRDRLQHALANARRGGGTVATIFLDVDNFKLVNDSLGHNVGDILLKGIAERLQGCVRASDTVARLGGDEFVLVLEYGTEQVEAVEPGLTSLLRKLLESVAQPVTLSGRVVCPTGSLGVTLFPRDGEDVDTLLRNADAAMYRAKDLGRNRFQFFTAEVHERIRLRMELESSLRLALERDEFELHYQPQVAMQSGAIEGVEALLRWRHPERGLVRPAEFIRFAEETGLIVPIGAWVLKEACRQNKRWQDLGLPPMTVAVNMSALQCEQADVVDVVQAALRETGLEPRYLELEITESISMANPELSVPLMERLKATGVTLSIDDFGTGFSNLSYLRRFPVDRLKIDLSFVREIASDPGSLAISEAIITMSHSLNLQVVAEGVETAEQLKLLDDRNCDLVQGYYFSPPLAGEALVQLLREFRRLPGRSPASVHAAPTLVM